jgi:aryl-alcohol dehydrogenase-like predicted oxidoreductase
LGASGLKVSRIALGRMSYGDPGAVAWYLSEDAAEPIVRHAVEAGVTLFDTADMYSAGVSEQLTGRLLGKLFGRRGDYVLATKLYYPTGPGPNDRGLSRKHIMDAVDASLRRLGTDYIDLYQLHRWDAETPVEETMRALDDALAAMDLTLEAAEAARLSAGYRPCAPYGYPEAGSPGHLGEPGADRIPASGAPSRQLSPSAEL